MKQPQNKAINICDEIKVLILKVELIKVVLCIILKFYNIQ